MAVTCRYTPLQTEVGWLVGWPARRQGISIGAAVICLRLLLLWHDFVPKGQRHRPTQPWLSVLCCSKSLTFIENGPEGGGCAPPPAPPSARASLTDRDPVSDLGSTIKSLLPSPALPGVRRPRQNPRRNSRRRPTDTEMDVEEGSAASDPPVAPTADTANDATANEGAASPGGMNTALSGAGPATSGAAAPPAAGPSSSVSEARVTYGAARWSNKPRKVSNMRLWVPPSMRHGNEKLEEERRQKAREELLRRALAVVTRSPLFDPIRPE